MKTRKLFESYSEQSAGRLAVLPVHLGGNSTIGTASQSKAERERQLCSQVLATVIGLVEMKTL